MILKLYFQEEHTLDKFPIKRKCSPASTRVINLLLGRHGKAVAACFIAGRSASPKAHNSMVDQFHIQFWISYPSSSGWWYLAISSEHGCLFRYFEIFCFKSTPGLAIETSNWAKYEKRNPEIKTWLKSGRWPQPWPQSRWKTSKRNRQNITKTPCYQNVILLYWPKKL